MRKIIAVTIGFITSVALIGGVFETKHPQQNVPVHFLQEPESSIEMPIQSGEFTFLTGGVPVPERDEKHNRWLSASVGVKVRGGVGSGTIVYYDSKEGYAYVQSCGHLWKGAIDSRVTRSGCELLVWYHNDKKLSSPETYKAEILYSNGDVWTNDVSLLRFKPNWAPNYMPIAPLDYKLVTNTMLHSLGCDKSQEVAHYAVKYIGFDMNKVLYATTENSPRPGRSGGGLMNDDYLIGICRSTSNVDGTGTGFFTKLGTIHKANTDHGYDFLNKVSGMLVRKIPVIDRNGPQGKYSPDYIPVPNRN